MISAKPNSAVASQPCPSGHITADKREIKDFPKFASQTSFIRNPLAEIPHAALSLKHMKEGEAVAIKGPNLITISERQ